MGHGEAAPNLLTSLGMGTPGCPWVSGGAPRAELGEFRGAVLRPPFCFRGVTGGPCTAPLPSFNLFSFSIKERLSPYIGNRLFGT